jgi:ketosteroid isomerase-like protein
MEASAELRDLVLGFYDSVNRGDATGLEQMLSADDDAVFIGTDPREWWRGPDARAAMRAQAAEMGNSLSVHSRELQTYSEGNIGWAVDQAVFRLADGRELPFRSTYIFRKEGGGWKLVHSHSSFGIRNEDALGQTLTI